MNSNPKIKLGTEDLVPGEIEPKDESIRISMVLEGDLLDALKEKAASLGLPYQTLMKLYLRQAVGIIPERATLNDIIGSRHSSKGHKKPLKARNKQKRTAG